MDSLLSLIQWPAMAVTLLAAWLVSCPGRRRRYWGFWCFILSNVMWIAWGWNDGAYSLIALQAGLFLLNLRGERQNEPSHEASGRTVREAAPCAAQAAAADGRAAARQSQ